MSALERLGLGLMHRLDPERAHGLAIRALRLGIAPLPRMPDSPRLRTRFAGLELPNPVGLAAGFDKNAEVVAPLLKAGFGFVEVGAVTPRPQPGNPRPRLFRLPQDRAIINRFGFNSEGMEAVAARLERRPASGVVGINLGANKDSDDKAADFAAVLTRCGLFADFATVNVSSPNTERLRDLQGAGALRAVLERVQAANQALSRPLPLMVKIAPDLDDAGLDAVAAAAAATGLDAIVATNTTTSRPDLHGPHAAESGGLSGRPLMHLSTLVLAKLAERTDLPVMGVGGIADPKDAYSKILAGAGAVQLYSALVYEGLGLVGRIGRGLDRYLTADGYGTVAEAVGQRREIIRNKLQII
ncbi:quinone-dependent dihydroorotate dehydrogenase [Rhodobacteraceae bacterium 2CG4]|uniref:Dihydroorotate dehydrogenase (quinone) n=1 Tax=Halovulum marinum TaxID=2662447 RepID=A0A6L5Z3C4_9RHOB|nr:quinone-dependent dihydroorotate dehydrogenase [Halovulum marinum]MSU91073.1 quinone-dependent dihydroorotate dehydrogenase [Halovulum marinum]